MLSPSSNLREIAGRRWALAIGACLLLALLAPIFINSFHSQSFNRFLGSSKIENCLATPLKAVRTTAEGSMVKVKADQGWRQRQVRLGESNGAEVIIIEGLKAGDRIASDFAKAK